MKDLKITIEYKGHEITRRYLVEGDPSELPDNLNCFEIRDVVEYLNDFDREIKRLASEFN